MSYDGTTIDANEDKVKWINAIPIGIHYQIDVYTRYLEEADDYMRNIVFNIINYPKLHIEIPYMDAKFSHISNIRMASEIEDNSDIPERLIPGQFTRLTVMVDIDDAYLWDVRVKDTVSIDGEVIVEYDLD